MSERGYRGLTDEALREIDYSDSRYDRTYKLGQYEPGYTIMDYLVNGSYEIGETDMYIADTVWGDEHIGDQPYDQLLIELARTPLFRRLQSIEQLTLGAEHATMPNSMYFSRWQHIWGSAVFVRKMLAGRDDIDDRQKMVLQLRTLLSDVGHTAFSHLGDFMFQGPNGGEDLHDKDLKSLLQVSGVEKRLQRYGFSLEETVFPEVQDWVECDAPDLCVDRVDYGFREIVRWVAPTFSLPILNTVLQNPQSIFEISPEGRLIMKDTKIARYFGAAFNILPTEHWSHPVHRVQLQLFQSAVRSSVIEKSLVDNVHPREAMYGIDSDFMAHFRTWAMIHLQSTMKQIAVTQRRIFTNGRQHDLAHIFQGIENDDWEFPEFPNPLEPYTWQTREFSKPYPANLTLDVVDTVSGVPFESSTQGLVVNMPPLKRRVIDPPIRCADGTVKRLSALDPSYQKFLEGQRVEMARTYRATVLMRQDIAKKIVEEHVGADTVWPELLKRPRSDRNLQRIIREVMPLAAAYSFDVITESSDEGVAYTRRLGRQGVLFGT